MRGIRSSGYMILPFCALFYFCGNAYSADTVSNGDFMGELKELKKIIARQEKRITELENQVRAYQSEMDRQCVVLEKHDEVIKNEHLQDLSARLNRELEGLKNICGLEIGAGITAVGQGTPNANNGDATDGEDSRFDGSYSVDLSIAKTFEDYGMAFIHTEAGQGDTIEGELSVFSNVNRDAGESGAHVDITEAWYEHYFLDNQIVFTAGKIDASGYIDTNEYANDECTQFLGHIFRNSAVIDWPDDNGLGCSFYLAPEGLDFISAGAVYMDEDGDWENLFDNPFIAAQLNFMPAEAFDYDAEMWGGNYRVIFWYNGAPHARVKNPDDFERGNTGFGISCDQMITDICGVFGRFGWADPDRNDIGYDWSVGGRVSGRHWGREEDVIAVAVGQAIPGEDYKDVNGFDNAETHLEAYYSCRVNEHFTLTPDMQVIWEPNGGGTISGEDSDTIFVYGIRSQIDF